MDSYYAGWLSLIPPILAITLALLTKEVVFSLFLGIFAGALIYALGVGLHPVAGTIGTVFDVITGSADLNIIVFVCLLGALVSVITLSGGSKAYGKWASTKLKNGKLSLAAAAVLGIVIFIDDYFNCLTVGTVMKPLTDKYKISRAKLAYIIDCTAAPICMIAPISSWAAAVGSNLEATGYYDNGFQVFLSTIPLNLYAILSLIMIFIIIFTGKDYGPMAAAEKAAAHFQADDSEDSPMHLADVSDDGTVADMLLPIISLIIFAVIAMLYTGGFFTAGSSYHNLTAAFGNCATSQSLVWASFGALLVAMVMYIPRRLITFGEYMNGITEGFKSMVPACLILFLAWGIGAVCRDLLLTPEFVSHQLARSNIPAFLLPALIFIIAAFLSFSTGTAWGTFGILIPIIAPAAYAIAPQLLTVTLSATLAGSVFGDNCSPISDTTILSSAGSGCNHIEHVSTQLPYAMTVAACCIVGYLVSGLTGANVALTLGISIILLILMIFTAHAFYTRRADAASDIPNR